MKHKTKKIIISAVVLFSIFYFLFSTPALAQIELETALPKIPGIPAPSGGLPEYINYLFVFGLGIIGVIALAVMMFGGIQYILAAGNVGKTTEAKEWIKASLTGLIIALFSYIILLTINPDLVQFKTLNITPIQKTSEEIASACGGLGQAWGYYTDESDCAACGGVDACEIQTANDVQCYKCKFTS